MCGRLTLAEALIPPVRALCAFQVSGVSPDTRPVLEYACLRYGSGSVWPFSFFFFFFLSGFRGEETPDMSPVYLSGMIRCRSQRRDGTPVDRPLDCTSTSTSTVQY